MNKNQWLENFDEEDKPLAELLLDSIQIFTLTDVENELNNLLNKIDNDIQYAIYPVMDQKLIDQNIDYLDLLKSREILFNKNESKINDADSEFVIMHFIRNSSKSKKNIHNMPLKEDIKKLKIRGIIIMTDVMASGTQVNDFIRYFIQDKTIRSYISLGLIKEIKILCHLATNHSIKNLEKIKVYSKSGMINVTTAKYARTIERYFTDLELRRKILELCIKYARKKKYALGFGSTGLLSIYRHKSSNNIPAILLQGTGDWNKIIEDRRLMLSDDDIEEEGIYIESNITLFTVLEIAKLSNKRILERLSETNGINTIDAKTIITHLKEIGYLSKYGYLTHKGQKLYNKLHKLYYQNIDIKKIDNYVEERYYPYYKKIPSA